jgi:hypothetical protein
VSSIGVAAHITAASTGGPRFDPNLDVQARRSARNGIWLCASCSVAIDRDWETQTVSVLRGWKTQAEAAATAERGKKLPRDSDAIDTVAMALTGLPTSFVHSAIANVHIASSRSLESLDPRFSVRSSFENGTSHLVIEAKEPTEISIAIDPRYEPDVDRKFEHLLDFGQTVDFDARAISFEGSKLLEELLAVAREGKFTLAPMPREAVQKLWALNTASGQKTQFEDVHGTISVGLKQMNFSGQACRGMFSFSYSRGLESGDTRATVNLQLNLAPWEGLDIRRLPYLEPLNEFLSALDAGATFVSALAIDGREVLRSRPAALMGDSFVSEILPLLQYTHAAAKVAGYLGAEVPFHAETAFSVGALRRLVRLGEIAQEQGFRFDSVASPIEMNIVLGPDFQSVTKAFAEDASQDYWIQQPSEKIMLFGSEVALPPQRLHFRSVTRSFSKPLSDWAEGDEVTVTLKPETGFMGAMYFELGGERGSANPE